MATVNLPGYDGVDANLIAAILDEVHDIAQELTYMRHVNLRGLDAVNAGYVDSAFAYAERRIQDDLADVMLEIRHLRTPLKQGEKQIPYRSLVSRYDSTFETKE